MYTPEGRRYYYRQYTMDNNTPTFKVVLLGDLGVGKTCMRSQFVHHIFTNAYKATIGGDYLTSTVVIPQAQAQAHTNTNTNTNTHDVNRDNSQPQQPPEYMNSENQKCNLQIWDTAGQERFNSISQAFYRGTDIVVLVYDITNYESVLSLRNWFNRFIDHCHVEKPGVIIVGNKGDKLKDRCVDLGELKDILTNSPVHLQNSIGEYINWETDIFEICSKSLDSVNDVFNRVAQLGLELLNNDTSSKIVGFDTIDVKQVISSRGRCMC